MIETKEYVRRRRQLMRMAGRDAIVIVPAAPERVRSNDSHYPYRQDSDFHYLSGFPEPDAVLALIPGREQGEMILFCRERDAERERWDGARAGTEGAVARIRLRRCVSDRGHRRHPARHDRRANARLLSFRPRSRVRSQADRLGQPRARRSAQGRGAAARVRRAVASPARSSPVQVAQRAARHEEVREDRRGRARARDARDAPGHERARSRSRAPARVPPPRRRRRATSRSSAAARTRACCTIARTTRRCATAICC